MNKLFNLEFTEEWGMLNPNNIDLNDETIIEIARAKAVLDNNGIVNTKINELYDNLNEPFKSMADNYIKKFTDYLKDGDLIKLFGGAK